MISRGKTVTDIPVMDSNGNVIGQAVLTIEPDGADVHVVIFDGTGMDIVRAITNGLADGIQIKIALPPMREATRDQ